MDRTDEEKLRHVELTVLDAHHRRCRLLLRDEQVATSSILRQFACVIRDIRTGKNPKSSFDAKSTTINQGLRGLAHCLRWIKAHCSLSSVAIDSGERTMAEEALELLQWSVQYDPLFNQHTAYSRIVDDKRLVEADVDEAERKITFSSIFSGSPRFFVSQVESRKRDDEREARFYPDFELSQRSKPWFDSAKWCVTGLMCDDETIRSSGALQVAESWLESTLLPELGSTVSLGDFKVGELRRVLGFLHVYSLFRTRLQDCADDRGQFELFSSVIKTDAVEFVSKISRSTDVEAPKVSAILEILTFVVKPLRITCAQKPFVKTEDGSLMFVPRVFLSLNLQHMFIGALNITKSGQRAYSHAINPIESSGVDAIFKELSNTGVGSCQRQKQVNWTVPDGAVITPDIVLLSHDSQEALVIDVKHSCPPFGPADVHSDIEDMDGWKVRMAKYVAAFSSNSDMFGQHFQLSTNIKPRVFGLILMRWPFPIPAEFSLPIVCIDWPSLREKLNTLSDSHSISDIFSWMHERPDVPIVDQLKHVQKEILVADWTYRYSVLSH